MSGVRGAVFFPESKFLAAWAVCRKVRADLDEYGFGNDRWWYPLSGEARH